MTEQDILKRISILFQQLELMNLYEEEFLGILGKRGYFNKINDILDEINGWKKVLNEKSK